MKSFVCSHPAIVMIALYILAELGLQLVEDKGIWLGVGIRLILALIMLVTLYLVAGKDMFTWQKKSGRYAFITCIYILSIAFGVFALLVVACVLTGEMYTDGLLLRFIANLCLTITVGLFEEGLFRGVITNGFVKIMPKTKAGLYLAILISGFVFGFAHVLENVLDIAQNPISVISQMTLKTIVTGAMGLLFATVYLKTKNIWVCMIIHALYDFVILMALAFLGMDFTDVQSVDIVKQIDLSEAFANIRLGLLIALPNIIIAYRVMRKLEPAECMIWK